MSDYLELKGKRTLVTGGTKGVGEAVVATLREEGATVITDRALLSWMLERGSGRCPAES